MVSRITAMMIQANDVRVIETPERVEAWTVKDDNLHALMLSCDFCDKEKLEDLIDELKSETKSPEEG